MIKCPSCGYENVDGTQFCEGCGEELAGASASATAPTPDANAGGGAPVAGPASTIGTDAAMVKCPACDNLNPPENVVCEVCGTELRPGTSFDDATSAGAPVAPSVAAAPFPAAAAPTGTPFDAAMPTPPAPDVAAPVPDFTAPPAAPDAASTNFAAPAPTAPADAAFDAASAPAMAPSAIDVAPDIPVAAPPVASTTAGATPGAELQPGRVKLIVEQGMSVGKQFVLGDVEILVGREDEEEAIYPDIDLSDQDEGYVHRRHATLRFENGGLSMTHLGGANKSRVNNRPLPDNEPQPVKMGDKVAFGKVVLRVHPHP